MADNNKNPRRTIWLSETEPLSHYDIWLSKNQHLNSEGESVSDSHVQRPCDYIFKVWDCDNWYPIIGFNATAANKIDTVKDATYSTTHNGQTITSAGYSEFHVPLFTNPSHSPSELFDGGSVGEVILEYVSEQDWENIFEGDAFTEAFNTYVIGGDNYNWGDLIQQFIESGDIEIPLATYENIGGARIQTDTTNQDYRGVPVLFGGPIVGLTYGGNTPAGFTLYGDYVNYNPDNSFLYIPGWALVDWLLNPTGNEVPSPFVSGWKGIDTQLRDNSNQVWVGLEGLEEAKAGTFCMAQVNQTDPSGVSIEWVDISDYLGIEEGIATEIVDGKVNLKYNVVNFTTIDNILTLKPATTNSLGGIIVGSGLNIQDGVLSVTSQSSQELDIEAGTGIKITDTGVNEKTISINIGSNNNGRYLKVNSTGNNVEWETIQSGEVYDAGDGIEIKTPSSGNKIINAKINECNETGYSSGFSAETSIEFRALSEGTVQKDVVTLRIDGTDDYGLHPYTYTKISLAGGGEITFKINGQTRYVDGDPIYVILELIGKPDSYTVSVEDSSGTASDDFISINNALVSDGTSMTFGNNIARYLITMQFGIVKIEPLGYIEANRTEPESEPEIEEPSEP